MGSENMEIVIKLSDDVYTRLFDNGVETSQSDRTDIETAIRRGVPNKSEIPTGWIPVSERLPEDGRPVLIYAWNVHHVIARYDSFRTENGYKKCWVTADAWNGNTEIRQEVIAWMPLPEPYEPQEKRGGKE